MRRYLAARITSWAGSSITLVALPVLLYQRTGDAALTGLLTALEAAPYLLLGLPALEAIEIDLEGETRTILPDGWRVVSASGRFSPEEVTELFADRPTEERARPYWLVRWAVPVVGTATGEQEP
ncbi:hypothetical protein ACFQ08_40330, partial [Streptosporangium algeriense]